MSTEAPMTTLESAMQAAERLRRLDAGTHWQDVYETTHYISYQAMYDRDKLALACWALSVLPEGKRPVTMEPEGRPTGAHEIWYIEQGEVDCHGCGCDDCLRNRSPAYATEAEARLALHYQRLDALIAAAAQAQQTGRE